MGNTGNSDYKVTTKKETAIEVEFNKQTTEERSKFPEKYVSSFPHGNSNDPLDANPRLDRPLNEEEKKVAEVVQKITYRTAEAAVLYRTLGPSATLIISPVNEVVTNPFLDKKIEEVYAPTPQPLIMEVKDGERVVTMDVPRNTQSLTIKVREEESVEYTAMHTNQKGESNTAKGTMEKVNEGNEKEREIKS